MATTYCKTRVRYPRRGGDLQVECSAAVVGAVYTDGHGWEGICATHLKLLLDRNGPTVIRGA